MADAARDEGGSPCSVDFGDGDELSPPPADTDEANEGSLSLEEFKELRGLQEKQALQVPPHVQWSKRPFGTGDKDRGGQEQIGNRCLELR